MCIESILLLAAGILAGGEAFFLLSGIRKKITRLSYVLWTVICGLTIVSAIIIFKENSNYVTGALMIWTLTLCAAGIAAFNYALRYQIKIVGIYAAVTAAIFLISAFIKPIDAIEKIGADPFVILHLVLLFSGASAMTLLCALSPIASRRPIKIKRWIRFSYLFLGLGIFSGCILSYRTIGWGDIWNWNSIQMGELAAFLILCTYLHGIKSYTKEMCIVPLSVFGFGMAAMRFLPAAVLMAIIFGVWIKKYGMITWKIEYKNPMCLFRTSTYIYLGISMLVVVIDQMVPFIIPSMIYAVLTTLYALALLAAWFLSQERLSIIKYIAIIVWNTALTLIVLVFYSDLNLLMFIICWCLLVPITFFIMTIKKSYKEGSAVKHVFLAFLMLGILGFYGFSTEYVDTMDNRKNEFTVENTRITTDQIKMDRMLILHKVRGDYSIYSIMAAENVENTSIISYCSRPMIYFFWIGCAGILGYSAICIMKKKV